VPDCAATDPATTDAVLARLGRLHPKSIDLTLDRTLDLLQRLGRPQDRLPPVVHVAGTNGKGSVIAMARAFLEAAGHRVHVYSSPHLVRFNERIRLAGRLIGEDDLLALLEECERVNGDTPITYFEITTAAAFHAFAQAPADFLLLETGLGGRADSTNVVDRPVATAITPVSMDHMQFLGETLAAIAGEKAAIQKPGVPSVIGPQARAIAEIIERRAAEIGAGAYRCGTEWTLDSATDSLSYAADAMTVTVPLPALVGSHQAQNAGIALALGDRLRAAGFAIPDQAFADGMADVDWPGRLQRLATGRLCGLVPPDTELWLDGGHNPAAGQALARTIAAWPRRPLHLIVGMLNSKDPEHFLAPLAPLTTAATAIAIPGESAALAADEIAAAADRTGMPCGTADDVEQALRSVDGPLGRVLICGSLYLAGNVLRANGTVLK